MRKYPYYENEHIPTIHFSRMVFLEFRNDWLQLKQEQNWYDISIALVEFHIEKDEMIEGWDVDVRLLGFGVRLRWNTFDSDNEIIKRAEDYSHPIS